MDQATKAKPKDDAAPDLRTADERQAAQVKVLTAEERAEIDKKVAASKKQLDEQQQAERIQREQTESKAALGKFYIGKREVQVVRKAEPNDLDYADTLACSVIKFVDTGDEQVVQDANIHTMPSRGAFV